MVVSLVRKGGGAPRTKHLKARMKLGKEMVDEERIVVRKWHLIFCNSVSFLIFILGFNY